MIFNKDHNYLVFQEKEFYCEIDDKSSEPTWLYIQIFDSSLLKHDTVEKLCSSVDDAIINARQIYDAWKRSKALEEIEAIGNHYKLKWSNIAKDN